jgi:hypothetical protein
MSVGPFDIAQVIARVKERVPDLRKVEGAAEYATAVRESTPATPAAYVILAQERSASHTGDSIAVVQATEVTFGVVLAVRNYRVGELGAQVVEALRPLIQALRDGLLGWRPDVYHTVCEHAGGRVTAYNASVLWWTETFRLFYQIRKVP